MHHAPSLAFTWTPRAINPRPSGLRLGELSTTYRVDRSSAVERYVNVLRGRAVYCRDDTGHVRRA